VKKINEIQSVDQKTGRAHTVDTFAWMPGTDSYKSDVESSEVLHRISFESGTAYQEILKDVKRRGKILEWMQRHNITEFDEVSRLVNLYYKDMDTLMEWVNKDLPPYKTKSDEEVKKLWETSTGLKVIE
jgi:hypothetical protein